MIPIILPDQLDTGVGKRSVIITDQKDQALSNDLTVLYEQPLTMGAQIVISQFDNVLGSLAQAADDFIVPKGQIWTILQLIIPGIYLSINQASALNLYFYADNGSGLPGAILYSFTNLTTFMDMTGVFIINLTGIDFPPGHYWISVQAVLSLSNPSNPTGNIWLWLTNPVLNNDGAVIEGAITTCNTFGRIPICYNLQPITQPDLSFTIIGTIRGIPPCLHPDTKVLTTKGLIPIKEIKRNDLVIDHMGKQIRVIYNILLHDKVREFIKIEKGSFENTKTKKKPFETIYIREKHPILWENKEIDPLKIPKNRLNRNNMISKFKINDSVNVYSLCTKDRTFVMMNGVPVCTWCKTDWETKSQKNKIYWSKV